MTRIKYNTFDPICMKATGIKDGKTCKFRLTYAFGGLSAYNETNGCWEYDWEWDHD